MATTLGFKKIIDSPLWRPAASALNASAAGTQLVGDMRNDASRHPLLYHLVSATVLNAYNPVLDDWMFLGSPALTGTFGVGAGAVFHPTQGPRGTIAAGASTTKVILSTALPAAVGVNQLANRGDGIGFKIRLVGSSSGGSGKVSEAFIVANTGGTTPTIWIDSTTPFSFTPASGDTYEILSGRVFLLSAGALASGMWKYYDCATNSYSASLSTTNLPGTVNVDSQMVALSEGHVPYNKTPGVGFLGTLVSTATAAGTITGTAAGGDAAVTSNQYRNFQVRVVQDVTTPTAVGQRRRITSHTAGASPVYTLASNWTVTPTSGATFVVENDDDKIILFSSGNTIVFNYNIGANTWDSTTWATAAANQAGGVAFQAFGLVPDIGAGAQQSQIFRVRGGGTTNVDILDIAGAATGAWSNAIVYGNLGTVFNTGTSGCYDPFTLQGRYVHLNVSGLQHNVRLDLLNRVLEPETYLRIPLGSAVVGGRHATVPFIDGATVLAFVYHLGASQTSLFDMAVQF